MSTSIGDMLAQAEQRGAQVPATTGQGGGAVQAYQPAKAPSLLDMLNSGMSVDHWLKVSEDGLKITADGVTALVDNIDVVIDMTEVQPTQAVKYGNPPTYHKTFDGIRCADGQTLWQDALAEAAKFGGNAARPYKSADIPMTLTQDVTGKGNKVVAEAGQRLGYSLSTTNGDAWRAFLKAGIAELGEEVFTNSTVAVRLGYEARTNKNKNTWGVVTFEFLGLAGPDGSED